jgi:hypothetical protein
LERNGLDGPSDDDDSEYQEPSESSEEELSDDSEISNDMSEDEESTEEDEDEERDIEEEKKEGEDDLVSEPEIATNDPVIEKITEPEIIMVTEEINQPFIQIQTPPITPEQPVSASRKRPLPLDDIEEDDGIPDIPLVREPSSVLQTPDSSVITSNVLHLQSVINDQKQELEYLRARNRAGKRRKVDDEETGRKGWSSVAAAVGKYTIAGLIGGVATVAGLIWAAEK